MNEFLRVSEVSKKEKGNVSIRGWVHNTRVLGEVGFLVLKDSTGMIQITAHKKKVPKKIFDFIDSINRESVISVEGSLVKSDKAPGGIEINPKKLEIISEAGQPLPIDVLDFSNTELPKRLDYRFLDLHNQRTQAIFKIQSEIVNSFRKYFYDKGFIEIQPPGIISSASEGGTELFEVEYFEKKAYLAQSPQLYKQMVACSVGNCFSTSAVWRAEKHNTTRHINEIRQLDIEMPFSNQMDIMREQEGVVKFIVEMVLENCKKEIEILGLKDKLKVPEAKYLSYEETLKVLEKNNVKIPFGEDLTPEAERKLWEIYPDQMVFVHSWPLSLKPFYIMPTGEKVNSKFSEGFDMIYGGLEISSGGQRIHIPELLEKRLKSNGLNPKNFKSYIDSFRYGAPPHGGWSIGLERITQIICGLDNIKEATLFPRDRDRLVP